MLEAGGQQAGIKLGGEDFVNAPQGTEDQQAQSDLWPGFLSEQVYSALSEPGGHQYSPEQVPQPEDEVVPTEETVVAFAEAADAVKDHADTPEEGMGAFFLCIALEHEISKYKTDQ